SGIQLHAATNHRPRRLHRERLHAQRLRALTRPGPTHRFASIVWESLISLADCFQQPAFGAAPFAHYCDRRYSYHLGRLIYAESAEIPQLDDLSFARIDCRQVFQSIIKRDQFRAALLGADDRFIKRNLERTTTSLCIPAASRVVYQNAPHRLRGYRVEVSSILPSHVLVIDEPEISLI